MRNPMKVRDIGKAILDFELSKIPHFIIAVITLCVMAVWGFICWAVNLYKRMWLPIILVCAVTIFVNLEDVCTGYCGYAVNLGDKYSVDKDIFVTVVVAIGGIIAAAWLDKKLKRISQKLSN